MILDVSGVDRYKITHVHLHEIQSEPINTRIPLPEIISHLNFLSLPERYRFGALQKSRLPGLHPTAISSPFRQSRRAVEGFEIGRHGFMYKLGGGWLSMGVLGCGEAGLGDYFGPGKALQQGASN